MTSETKIGLLVGMGVIILIGILVSEHLSKAQRQQHAQFDQGEEELDDQMIPSPPFGGEGEAPQRADPLPTPEELSPPAAEPQAQAARPRDRRQAEDPSPGAGDRNQAPYIIRQDHLWETMRVDPVDPREVAAGSGGREERDERPSGGSDDRLVPDLGDDFVLTDGPGQPPRASGDRPERRADADPPARGEADRIVHYVGENETLSGIARRYYDDPNYWRTIYEANRQAIPNPDLLRPGVRIVIPNEAGRANAAAGRSPRGESSAPAGASPTVDYTVRPGESLSAIARRVYGSMADWPKLYELNKDRIDNPDRLSEGDVIRVPRNR